MNHNQIKHLGRKWRCDIRTKSCNDYLKQVGEKIMLSKPPTMRIGRHTFAQISSDKIPVNILQRLYWHSDIKTTRKEGRYMGVAPVGYINKITESGRKYIALQQPQDSLLKWAFEELAQGIYSGRRS